MRKVLGCVILLLFVGITSAADKPIRFPEFVVPSPKQDLTVIPVLTQDVIYVIDSDVPLVILESTEGFVKITEEKGPLPIRAKFIDKPNKAERREFKGKNIYLIEALENVKGRLTLFVMPEGGKAKDVIKKTIDVESGEAPLPPPKPDPKPDPKPPEPKPIDPSPIPVAGFRVMILYETATKGKLHLQQLSILTSIPIRNYLISKCASDVTTKGDGKAYKIWDKDELTNIEGKEGYELWAAAMKRPRTSLPWLIISNHPNGGFEGPLPNTVAETLTLLKKYGG